jgi:hypothetical protein
MFMENLGPPQPRKSQLAKFGLAKFGLAKTSARKNLSAQKALTRMTQAQDELDHQTQRLIDRQKEKAGKQNHYDNENRRDQGLATRRPSHLIRFGANFLQKLEGISHSPQTLVADRTGCRKPNWQ